MKVFKFVLYIFIMSLTAALAGIGSAKFFQWLAEKLLDF